MDGRMMAPRDAVKCAYCLHIACRHIVARLTTVAVSIYSPNPSEMSIRNSPRVNNVTVNSKRIYHQHSVQTTCGVIKIIDPCVHPPTIHPQPISAHEERTQRAQLMKVNGSLDWKLHTSCCHAMSRGCVLTSDYILLPLLIIRTHNRMVIIII